MTSYTPKGVCSRQINIEVNGDTIESGAEYEPLSVDVNLSNT